MGAGLHVLGIGGWVLAVVNDGIYEVLSKDDRFHLSLQRLLEDIVLGQMHWLICFVGCVQLRLGGKEHIVGYAE